MDHIRFKRILIANRGEIAIRIARAAFELGIQTVGVYSHEDRFALHRYKTDESYKIGQKGEPLKAYLDIESILKLAKNLNIDAIHPGYGFLSENAELARKCEEIGVCFVGPSPSVLQSFGDKVAARQIAEAASIQVIPGTMKPVNNFEDARKIAEDLAYPVTLKAVSGGGGKGIRKVNNESELRESFDRAKSEAQANFGASDVYLEKTIVNPRHIEVQILADRFGNIVHLYERDCSIQRRNQKVVEVAPAIGISKKIREELHHQAKTIAKYVNYVGLGTVEFLVDESSDKAYFLEVNPRIQVEHTVTEMITGIDLVQASILVAEGVSLNDPRIGIENQNSINTRGVAIQCRVTTEDPLNQFSPDIGTIIAYRPAAGFGIRLDEGHGTTGGEVTPYYDSLLVKVTASSNSLAGAATKMFRSLSEFRIRGVKHNIPLLKNVMKHPSFLQSNFNTSFLESYPEVFKYSLPKDRATKLLKYLAEVTVNDLHDLGDSQRRGSIEGPSVDFIQNLQQNKNHIITAKEAFDQEGSKGLVKWIKDQKSLLLTDTTMRDAHQSLFATRLRSKDILKIAPIYSMYGDAFFSLEVWGGATFDTAMRFLKEDPWERLAQVRQAIPNVLLQMLLRGDNAVGYTNYPKWVIKDFIKETIATGLDIFRIFDCLNQPDKMKVAIEEVKKHGAIAELSICYTGDIRNPRHDKYNLNYYINVAKELEKMGADILCIKDMAGLLKPNGVQILINALKEHVDLPIHLHTHDTSGTGIAMLLEAAKSGCEIVDGAISSMSGLTSQPSLNAIIASLQGESFQPQVPLEVVDELARYWEVVRSIYHAFDPGIKATSTDVYVHEIPGGQYSNFYEQAKKVGLSSVEFFELTNRYREVNEILGDIIKVTPSSKVVGDFALLLHKHNITGEQFMTGQHKLDFPDSVVSFLKGHMGRPYGGFPEKVRSIVLGDNPPEPETLEISDDDCLESVRKDLSEIIERTATTKECLSYRLYPKVYKEYWEHVQTFGKVTEALSTPVFFYGMKQGEEIEVDLEKGKTLYVSLKGLSKSNIKGLRTVFFKLNGFDREIIISDKNFEGSHEIREKAEKGNEQHVPAPMPGKVMEILIKEGDLVKKGDVLVVTESMKMEYAITARSTGTVAEILIKINDLVESGDLLIKLK